MTNVEICRQDNNLQKKLIRKEITLEEFNESKKQIHNQFQEPELIKILAKYGYKK